MNDAERAAYWSERAHAAEETVIALKEELAGNREYAFTRWQMKAERQRKALRLLQRRVVNQRAVLGVLDFLGRGLTSEEWHAHKGRYPQAEQDAELLVG